jgi:salicylate hydroxylase
VAFVSDKQKAGTPFEGRWVSDASPEELEEAYQDFEPDVKCLLKVSLWLCRLSCHPFFAVCRKTFKMGASRSK